MPLLGSLVVVVVLSVTALVITTRQLQTRDRLWRAREARYQEAIAALTHDLAQARLGRAPAPVGFGPPAPVARPETAGPTRRRSTATIRVG